jgi:hypothetical protein
VTLDEEILGLIKAGAPRLVPLAQGVPNPEVDIVQQLRNELRMHPSAKKERVFQAIMRLAYEEPPRLFVMHRDQRILFIRTAGSDESTAAGYRNAIISRTSFPRRAIEQELAIAQAALIQAAGKGRPIEILMQALELTRDFCRGHVALLKVMEILHATEDGYTVEQEPAMFTSARVRAAKGAINPRARRPVPGVEDNECLALLAKFRAAANPITGMLPAPPGQLSERTTINAEVAPEHIKHLRSLGFLWSEGAAHLVRLADKQDEEEG